MLLRKVLKEVYKVTHGKSIFQGLPEKDYNAVIHFTQKVRKGKISSRNLAMYRRVAEIIDVPLDFIIAIERMEGIDDGKNS